MAKKTEIDYSKTNIHPWRKIFQLLKIYKKSAVLMLVFVILLSILDVTYPLLNQYAILHYIELKEFETVPVYITVYVVFALVYGLIVTGFIYFGCNIQYGIAYELRKEAFIKLQLLSFSYYDDTPQGWIMARVTSDSRKISYILSFGFVDLLWSALLMLCILIIMFVKNPMLSLIILITVPVVFCVSYFIQTKILKSYRDVRKVNSEITGELNETYMASNTVKSLVIEQKKNREFDEVTTKYKKYAIKAGTISALFGPTVFVLGYFGVAATLYEGGIMVLNKVITVSELYLFIQYCIQFFDPIIMLSQVLGNLQQARASAERIVSLIEQEPEIKDSEEVIAKYGTILEPKKENFEALKGDVEFKNVDFKYNKGEKVLENFNLKIKAGMNVALVGHTGSGKSTIINLISRFYEPTSGEILIDGINYKERSLTWLHSNLGYVLQTPQLFSGSVIDNVRYGKLDATKEEVINACKLVKADEIVKKLENGYDTDVSGAGSNLSNGEKQLISFARALVKDPKILILDEATSSVDTKTEHLIQEAIDVTLKGRTSFVVAHRLSTIVNADLILVMDNGKIVEQGKHEELLKNKGYYFNLYQAQFKKEQENKIIN